MKMYIMEAFNNYLDSCKKFSDETRDWLELPDRDGEYYYAWDGEWFCEHNESHGVLLEWAFGCDDFQIKKNGEWRFLSHVESMLDGALDNDFDELHQWEATIAEILCTFDENVKAKNSLKLIANSVEELLQVENITLGDIEAFIIKNFEIK